MHSFVIVDMQMQTKMNRLSHSVAPYNSKCIDFVHKGSTAGDEYRRRIEKGICDQLKKCPNSMIVFDEVELVAPETIAIMTAFMDDSVPTVQCGDSTVKTGEGIVG